MLVCVLVCVSFYVCFNVCDVCGVCVIVYTYVYEA